ncbi:hypothetical protein J3458_003641 [Metarhizium acridum]|uniref:uncharacterized protein n=1 Tax=Metarhizium acridum TaxID=92637 RepID=UPI001C6B2601|nr:hypothetical protein J3458_003641 [Metarhizium acridum]
MVDESSSLRVRCIHCGIYCLPVRGDAGSPEKNPARPRGSLTAVYAAATSVRVAGSTSTRALLCLRVKRAGLLSYTLPTGLHVPVGNNGAASTMLGASLPPVVLPPSVVCNLPALTVCKCAHG